MEWLVEGELKLLDEPVEGELKLLDEPLEGGVMLLVRPFDGEVPKLLVGPLEGVLGVPKLLVGRSMEEPPLPRLVPPLPLLPPLKVPPLREPPPKRELPLFMPGVRTPWSPRLLPPL